MSGLLPTISHIDLALLVNSIFSMKLMLFNDLLFTSLLFIGHILQKEKGLCKAGRECILILFYKLNRYAFVFPVGSNFQGN